MALRGHDDPRAPEALLNANPEVARRLHALSRNLWWTWHPPAVALFSGIDPFRWERNHHNPVALLADLGDDGVAALAEDQGFVMALDAVWTAFRDYLDGPTWFDDLEGEKNDVAYFSMEFGLHESLKTYSGGLGVLAGDHLKSSSDLGVPLTGVSLFYHGGYFRQVIDDGQQLAAYPRARMARLPMQPVVDANGTPIHVVVPIDEHDAKVWAWRLDVGRTRLYFLDTDRPENPEPIRQLTRALYGGGQQTRIMQEALLGLGGVRMLRAVGADPDVFHMNEGHCAFVGLELIKERTDRGVPYDEALADVRSRCVFTTHTPVPAGHDRFYFDLVDRTLRRWRASARWLKGTIMDLGRVRPGDWDEPLCMTVLAMRTSHGTNGVSKKHGEVSRGMWHEMWPDRTVDDVPIGHITNGVHPVFWMAPESQSLYDAEIPGWRDAVWDPEVWAEGLARIPDATLWDLRNRLRRKLVQAVAERSGATLDPDALTLGFARRFAAYKRGDLLFTDPDRLHRLFTSGRPVQIVYSGKAHPADRIGQGVLERVLQWSADPRFRNKVVFLEDYDIDVGALLTSGVDVWLNNPRRPLEASGTSGQKVTLNAGLNLSVLDGWWLEGHAGDNGWAIGDDTVHADIEAMDAADAEALYQALENEVLPLWEDRGGDGIPHGWIDRVRRSTITCASAFNSHRMVRDYVTELYKVSTTPTVIAAP